MFDVVAVAVDTWKQKLGQTKVVVVVVDYDRLEPTIVVVSYTEGHCTYHCLGTKTAFALVPFVAVENKVVVASLRAPRKDHLGGMCH